MNSTNPQWLKQLRKGDCPIPLLSYPNGSAHRAGLVAVQILMVWVREDLPSAKRVLDALSPGLLCCMRVLQKLWQCSLPRDE